MGSKQEAISEFEAKCMKNREDNKAFLATLMKDFPRAPVKPVHRCTTRRRESYHGYVKRWDLQPRRNPSRSCRPDTPERRRSDRVPASSPTLSSNNHLVVKFNSFHKIKRPSTDDDDDYDYDEADDENVAETDDACVEPRAKRRRRAVHNYNKTTVVKRDISSVTADDLKRVADHVSEKRYNAKFGSTCHQCRQKTDDMKTICTSDDCVGTRGQFCGPCLRNRYGEDVKEALQNKQWQCPPCRGICNCSFCRRDAGKASTGILIHLARHHGFDDVNSYLRSLRRGEKVKKSRCDVEFDSVDSDDESSTQRDTGPAL